jgi:hypothetical protein
MATSTVKSVGRPIGAKSLTLREHRFKAEAEVLKATNSVLQAKLEVAKVKAKEAQARIAKLTKKST